MNQYLNSDSTKRSKHNDYKRKQNLQKHTVQIQPRQANRPKFFSTIIIDSQSFLNLNGIRL